MQNDNNIVGARIRAARKSKPGFTMKKLGDEIGVSEQAISQYELGKRPIQVETLRKIAAALGVSVEHLLDVDAIVDEFNHDFRQKMNTAVAPDGLEDVLDSFVVIADYFNNVANAIDSIWEDLPEDTRERILEKLHLKNRPKTPRGEIPNDPLLAVLSLAPAIREMRTSKKREE